jgi:site-specific recombinase XerD
LKEYLYYSETIRSLSVRSVNGYYIDLRTFFRFLKIHKGLVPADTEFEKIPFSDVDLSFVKNITKRDVYEFLHFVTNDRSNSPATRARKLSSVKGFFKYCTVKRSYFPDDPCQGIEMPTQPKRLPRYLSLEESRELLESVQSDFPSRDYCILTLFLNCGMRLSELVGINLSDCKADTLRVIGKGNKERQIYLNKACLAALDVYRTERNAMPNIEDADRDALFLSKRTGRRLSPRRVQQIVERSLAAAGLDGKGYSTHKLRHTAATLMHQYGHVDMLALKEVLGHARVSTTEIYTHLSQAELKEATDANPLSSIKTPQKKKEN